MLGVPGRTREEEEFEKLATGTIAGPVAESLGASMPFRNVASPPIHAPARTAAPPVIIPSPLLASHPAAAAAPASLPRAPALAPPLAPPSTPRAPALAPPLAPPAIVAAPPPAVAPLSPSGPVAPPAAVPLPGWVPVAAPAPIVSKIDTWKLHEAAAARRTSDEPATGDAPQAEASSATAPVATVPVASHRPSSVEVAWFESTMEVELAAQSKSLRAQIGDGDDEFLSPAEATSGSAERSRRNVARWLSSAAPIDADRLAVTYTAALGTAPGERHYVVLGGELAWTFDPRESIRAWIAIGTPLSADPRIKDAIETAERSLHESLVAVPDVLHGACDRLRDTVRSVTKMAGATPIEAAAERYLVEERGFGRRRVWGQIRIRAHLHPLRGRVVLPCYFVDSAGWEAPLSQRFAARVLAEVRSRQDPTEAAAISLRAIAFGIELGEPAR